MGVYLSEQLVGRAVYEYEGGEHGNHGLLLHNCPRRESNSDLLFTRELFYL